MNLNTPLHHYNIDTSIISIPFLAIKKSTLAQQSVHYDQDKPESNLYQGYCYKHSKNRAYLSIISCEGLSVDSFIKRHFKFFRKHTIQTFMHIIRYNQQPQSPQGSQKDMSTACSTYQHTFPEFYNQIMRRAERNRQIKTFPSYLGYNIVTIGNRFMKGHSPNQDVQHHLKKILSEQNKDDDNQFCKPSIYKLRLEIELGDSCQGCKYTPVIQKLFRLRLNDNSQINLCLGCLLSMTKVSMCRHQYETRPKKKKGKNPQSKFVKLAQHYIHSIGVFIALQRRDQMSSEECSQQSRCLIDGTKLKGESKILTSSICVSKLNAFSSLIIVFLVDWFQKIIQVLGVYQ